MDHREHMPTYIPFKLVRAREFTLATCSRAICMFCLNDSGEFGSERVLGAVES